MVSPVTSSSSEEYLSCEDGDDTELKTTDDSIALEARLVPQVDSIALEAEFVPQEPGPMQVQVAYTARSRGLCLSRKVEIEAQNMQKVNEVFFRMKQCLQLNYADIGVSYDLHSRTITTSQGKSYDMRVESNIKQLLKDVNPEDVNPEDVNHHRSVVTTTHQDIKEKFKGLHEELEDALKVFLVPERTTSNKEQHPLIADQEFARTLTVSGVPVAIFEKLGLVEGGIMTGEGEDMFRKIFLARILHRRLVKLCESELLGCREEITELGPVENLGPQQERDRLKEKKRKLDEVLSQLTLSTFMNKVEFLLIAAHVKLGGGVDGESLAEFLKNMSNQDWPYDEYGKKLLEACKVAARLGLRILSERKQRGGVFQFFREKQVHATIGEQGAVALLSSSLLDIADASLLLAAEKTRKDFVRDCLGGAAVASYAQSDLITGLVLREILLSPEAVVRVAHDVTAVNRALDEFSNIRSSIVEDFDGEISGDWSYKRLQKFFRDGSFIDKLDKKQIEALSAPQVEASSAA